MPRSPEKRREVLAEYAALYRTHTIREIAALKGVSYGAARRRIRDAGVALRTTGPRPLTLPPPRADSA